ncbi:hypothetical protein [Maridesulfovibrio sp.]|uniref:hypothetical protein n=1 Tax=Maridesulfovibrio sp. TaxID=2795000 RepID=UPI0029F523B4|nr:hypothetical protein [Maridesulfovibrio sp.]
MNSVKALVSMHREDMAVLRSQAKKARQERVHCEREMDQAYKELRSQLAAEMPVVSTFSMKLRTPIALMVTLLGVFSI